MGSREGFRSAAGARRPPGTRLAEKAEMVRAETRARAEEKAQSRGAGESRDQGEGQGGGAGAGRGQAPRPEGGEARAQSRQEAAGCGGAGRRSLAVAAVAGAAALSRRERLALHRGPARRAMGLDQGRRARVERGARSPGLGERAAARRAALARARSGWQPVVVAVARGPRPALASDPGRPGADRPLRLGCPVRPDPRDRRLLDAMLAALFWIRDRIVGAARAVARWVDAHVTPARTFALIAAAAAVALAVSQFIDYRATAIGGRAVLGRGRDRRSRPSHRPGARPATPTSTSLLPLAIAGAAADLARAARPPPPGALGRRDRRDRVAGHAGRGPSAGPRHRRAGDAYEGTEAHLIEGFWTQLIASLVLVGCGLGPERAAASPAGAEPDRDLRRRAGRAPHERPGPGLGEAAGWGAGA